MHVFIDTNILLNFFHFSKDELDALSNVFASHQHGAVTVHLTEQVRDEFRRNREPKIKDALKRFNDMTFAVSLPSFMKAYDEYAELMKLAGVLKEKSKAIRTKADVDIARKKLVADALIADIFAKAPIQPTTTAMYEAACRRVQIGNPPGKNGSIGDAINWTALLENVPDGQDLHVISEDGDFYSKLDETRVNPFLEEEWKAKKKSNVRVYRTISQFLGEHFDGVAFPFDKDKDALIDQLAATRNFAGTHNVIAKLDAYGYFSLKEVERILKAAKENDQFGWIVTDYDASDFINRVAVPRRHEISDADYIAVLDKVAAEQASRIP